MSQLSRDLLEQAASLVTREKKKPKQASVRRAISTAYYALFHFMSDKVTGKLVGTTSDMADGRAWLGRGLAHRTMKNTCKLFANPNHPDFQALRNQLALPQDADLTVIADAFVNLQESRHRADYDLSTPVTRSDAEFAIGKVRWVFARWNQMEGRNPKLVLIFAVSLMQGNISSKH
jgi:uncharacterized protein (UPF0332 family)